MVTATGTRHSWCTLPKHYNLRRLMLALASIFDFDVWTSDVRQAYLQPAEPLSRAIFINNPCPEFSLDRDQCLQLLKPLYELCESGDLWHATLDTHHREDLGMSPLETDPTLSHLMINGILAGLSGSYVDDILRCGTKEFRKHCLSTNKSLKWLMMTKYSVSLLGFVFLTTKTELFNSTNNETPKRSSFYLKMEITRVWPPSECSLHGCPIQDRTFSLKCLS